MRNTPTRLPYSRCKILEVREPVAPDHRTRRRRPGTSAGSLPVPVLQIDDDDQRDAARRRAIQRLAIDDRGPVVIVRGPVRLCVLQASRESFLLLAFTRAIFWLPPPYDRVVVVLQCSIRRCRRPWCTTPGRVTGCSSRASSRYLARWGLPIQCGCREMHITLPLSRLPRIEHVELVLDHLGEVGGLIGSARARWRR